MTEQYPVDCARVLRDDHNAFNTYRLWYSKTGKLYECWYSANGTLLKQRKIVGPTKTIILEQYGIKKITSAPTNVIDR